jgi:hypothetical protein
MAELLEAVASWPTLLLIVVVFGFAPGFCLRLIVLAYLRNDPRRAKLIAELYAVPRVQRPLWVAEQLEVALFEGLAHRISAALRRLTRRHRARAQTGERAVRIRKIRLALALAGVLAIVLGAQVATVLVVLAVVLVVLAVRLRRGKPDGS